MAGVTLEHVTKTFGEVVAVNDLSLEIEDGEFLVLVGPSGCGKTTALRLVAGLEEITSGGIAIGGRRVEDVPPKDRDIAMVFQSYALYPHMSVFDNMAFGLKLRNMTRPEIERRVGEAAQLLGLEQLLKRKPKELSGGQRQRVALGRAIVRNPQVFLMDEPLSNLDAQLRVQTRSELIKLHQRLQTTTIYVTHDQVEAMTMGSRIAVMRDGLLQQLDTPTNLYERPANVFVAGFIGSPRMNFCEGELAAEGGRLWAQADGVRLALPDGHLVRLGESGSRRVVLGIRPEDLHLALDEGAALPEGRTTMMQVSLVENMGAEQLVHLTRNRLEFIARSTARRAPAPGDTVPVAFDTERLHIFDAATERVLAP